MYGGRSAALAVAALVLLGAGAAVAGATTTVSQTRQITELTLNGVVDPFTSSYVTGGIATAREDGDAAVLLTIDTPGGLDSSMRQITQAILNAGIPVICYTAPSGARAASAGTF